MQKRLELEELRQENDTVTLKMDLEDHAIKIPNR